MHFRMPSGTLLETEIALFFLTLFYIVMFLSMFSEPPEKEKYRARLTIRDPKNRFEHFIVNRRKEANLLILSSSFFKIVLPTTHNKPSIWRPENE